MLAVAAYVFGPIVPKRMGAFIEPLRATTIPYIQSLSQWQRWDIFAPDPLRRESAYRLEKRVRGKWVVAAVLDRASLPWYERAKQLKTLTRLEDDWRVLVPSYLKAQCEVLDVHSRELRLIVASRILPRDLGTLRSLRLFPLQVQRRILGTVRCF